MAKILLVEDNNSFKVAIYEALESLNHQVTEAEDGEIAMSVLQNETFDLIISDIQMPFATGMELLTWVSGNCPNTPVLFTSGYSYISNESEAKSFGAAGFLKKPFSVDELKYEVDRVLAAKAS